MKGTGLAAAVLLVLVAAVAAHRPINGMVVRDAEDTPDFEVDARVYLATHGIGSDALRRRILSINKAIAEPLSFSAGAEASPEDLHSRRLQAFISGLIEKRREQDRLEHPD
ncbi:unnamed protein product, partial [Ostreobium quekettii]